MLHDTLVAVMPGPGDTLYERIGAARGGRPTLGAFGDGGLGMQCSLTKSGKVVSGKSRAASETGEAALDLRHEGDEQLSLEADVLPSIVQPLITMGWLGRCVLLSALTAALGDDQGGYDDNAVDDLHDKFEHGEALHVTGKIEHCSL